MKTAELMQLIATLIVPIAFLGMWLSEASNPARSYRPVRNWWRSGVIFFMAAAVLGTLTPLLLAQAGLNQVRLFDLSHIGWLGLPVGLIALSGVGYGWHRLVHYSDFLWRTTHQLHHSALRVDVPGAFYTHPLEVVIKTTWGVLVLTVLLGLRTEVAAMTSSLLTFMSIFQHWNIRTPRWIGWFLARPEMHGLHHEYGVHGRNYGDIALWDQLFGTWQNADKFAGQVGFDEAKSGRIVDMLLMRDVHKG